MAELFSIAVDLIIWATFAVQLRDLWRDRANPARRALCLMLGFLGVTLMFGSSAVNAAVTRYSGIASFPMLLQHVTTMGSVLLGQVMFLRLTYPAGVSRRPTRFRAARFAAAVLAMTVLFALAPRAGRTTGMGPDSAGDPATVGYLVIFLGYLLVAVVELIRLCARYARQTDRVFLRRGLWLACAGLCFELAYLLHKAGYLAACLAGVAVPWREVAVSTWLILPAALLVMAGCVLPSLGPWVLAVRHRLGDYRDYRALGPLWRDVTAAFPEVVLPAPGVGLGGPFGDLGVRLYRRVIEIRDGQLALRPYVDPAGTAAIVERAGGAEMSGADLDVLHEAARLATALRARSTGVEARIPDGGTAGTGTAIGSGVISGRRGAHGDAGGPVEPSADFGTGADLTGEVAHLLRVAAAYRSTRLAQEPPRS